MMPRWGGAILVPEGASRERQALEIDTQRELRQLQARMEAMERNNLENIDTNGEEEYYE